MGGNNEEDIQVLFSTDFLPWCGGWRGSCSRSASYLDSDTDADGCGDEGSDDPDDIPAWECVMVTGPSSPGWLAQEDSPKTRTDHLAGIWWVPEPQGW